MVKQSYKSGQSPLTLTAIVVAVIVVVAVLGFIIVKFLPANLFGNSNELTQVAYDQTGGTNFAVKYPKSWKLVHTDASQVSKQSDINTITSSNGKVSVVLTSNVPKTTASCVPGSANLAFRNSDPISAFPEYIFASYVNQNSNNTYTYYVGAINKSDTMYEGNCTVGAFQIGAILPKTASNPDPQAQIGTLVLVFNDIVNDASNTLDKVNAAMKTDEYTIGKQIIQSLYLKTE